MHWLFSWLIDWLIVRIVVRSIDWLIDYIRSHWLTCSSSHRPATERDLADDAPWKRIQQNTFTRWANEHLKTVSKTIGSLETDLSDGLRLIALIEVLSGKKLPKHNKRPTFRSQKLENVSVALNFLQEDENIKLVNIGEWKKSLLTSGWICRFNQSINQGISQSINQLNGSIIRSINQSINQSINRHFINGKLTLNAEIEGCSVLFALINHFIWMHFWITPKRSFL